MQFEHNGGCYDFSHSLASEIPPGVIANVASDSGLSGLQNNTNLELLKSSLIEPHCEKTNLRGFRPGLTQTRLYNHTRWPEA